MRLITLLMFAVAAVAADHAKMDLIHLANGRSIVGTVESETEDAYTVRLSGSGIVLNLKKEKVSSIERGVADQPDPAATPRPKPPSPKPMKPREQTKEEKIDAGIVSLRREADAAGLNVTARMYGTIQPGCDADLAFRILGNKCQELSRTEIAGTVTAHYMWHNKDGSNLSLIFQNGIVVTRAQFGLR